MNHPSLSFRFQNNFSFSKCIRRIWTVLYPFDTLSMMNKQQQQQQLTKQWYRQMSMSSDCEDSQSFNQMYSVFYIFFLLFTLIAAYSIFLIQWRTTAMSSLATNAHVSIEIKPFDFTFSLSRLPTHSLSSFTAIHHFSFISTVRIATVVLSYLLILLLFFSYEPFYEPFGVNFYSILFSLLHIPSCIFASRLFCRKYFSSGLCVLCSKMCFCMDGERRWRKKLATKVRQKNLNVSCCGAF